MVAFRSVLMLLALSSLACSDDPPRPPDAGADGRFADRGRADTPAIDQKLGGDTLRSDGPRGDGPRSDQGGPTAGPCVATLGGPTYDYGREIVLDGAGNMFIVGTFTGTASFGTTSLTSKGDQDVFVAKLDSSCKVVWAVGLGGPGVELGNGIARDGSGNLYIAGGFEQSLACGGKTLTAQGKTDVLLAKLDGSGNVLWCLAAGGTDMDHGQDVQLDAQGNPYLLGGFRASASFGSAALTSKGHYDLFLAKLDPTGAFLWAVSAGGAKEDVATSVVVSAQGESYLTGYFLESATFGATSLTSKGLRDGFVAKVGASGVFSWITTITGTLDDWGTVVALDGAGEVYVTGNSSSLTTSFGNSIAKTAGHGLSFVGKLAPASGAFAWVTTFGGAETETSNALAVDGSGSYIAGYYGRDATFGSIKLSSPTNDSSEIFVAKLDPTGSFLWAKGATGDQWDSALSLAVDAAGAPHLVGFFSGQVSFGSKLLKNPGTGTDVFVARLSASGDL